ncbi:STAS domain-containing protein [Candidatus Mycobacterium methanotrophicum]|uniref:STAS domain-containing protein n=2 Tax=Candidatus Mycobacterium methanotrophicum TaxID=2943498 RepID=A0ABY4QMU7_9MYCO|nr:STAS domain-containing protein [Candidatus Mycobacterium methanotrophicum]UQX11572.1 STAS domain-containing protein [Candidatus Mycobacterium methanotrophicum]
MISADQVARQKRRRRQTTVVTITGEIDAANSDRVRESAIRMVPVANASMILDLSGVDFFAAQAISILIAVDGACRGAEVPWTLVPSRIVTRVLRLTGCGICLPTASSAPEALRQLTAAAPADRRCALSGAAWR